MECGVWNPRRLGGVGKAAEAGGPGVPIGRGACERGAWRNGFPGIRPDATGTHPGALGRPEAVVPPLGF